MAKRNSNKRNTQQKQTTPAQVFDFESDLTYANTLPETERGKYWEARLVEATKAKAHSSYGDRAYSEWEKYRA